MGYRTFGKWVILAPAEKLVAAVAAMRMELPPPPAGDCGWEDFELFKVKDIGYMRFEFEEWKWYTSFPSVDWYECVWSWCEEHTEDFELDGRRVHVGEDNVEETQTFGDGGYDIELYVHCSISDGEPDSGDPLITPA